MKEGGVKKRKEVEGEVLSMIDRRRSVHCALSASSHIENDVFFHILKGYDSRYMSKTGKKEVHYVRII